MGEVVRIVRQQFLNQERAPEPDLGEEGVAASTEELLKDYQAFLQAPQTYSVPCELHLVAPQAEFGCLLGLQVVARPPADWGSAQGEHKEEQAQDPCPCYFGILSRCASASLVEKPEGCETHGVPQSGRSLCLGPEGRVHSGPEQLCLHAGSPGSVL